MAPSDRSSDDPAPATEQGDHDDERERARRSMLRSVGEFPRAEDVAAEAGADDLE